MWPHLRCCHGFVHRCGWRGAVGATSRLCRNAECTTGSFQRKMHNHYLPNNTGRDPLSISATAVKKEMKWQAYHTFFTLRIKCHPLLCMCTPMARMCGQPNSAVRWALGVTAAAVPSSMPAAGRLSDGRRKQ